MPRRVPYGEPAGALRRRRARPEVDDCREFDEESLESLLLGYDVREAEFEREMLGIRVTQEGEVLGVDGLPVEVEDEDEVPEVQREAA